jgi:hypothetical protein
MQFEKTAVWIRWMGVILCTLAVLGFTGVMAENVFPYFRFEYAVGFLGTKTDVVLHKVPFQWAFYTHISSSLVVLLLGPWQFFPGILRRFPRFHRVSGYLYVGLILGVAAPSGWILGWYANGGLPAKVGFVLQSTVWWVVTFLALLEIKQQRYLRHTQMMIRSFAVTLAAMSLRTESYAMYYFLGTKPIETYVTVTWFSWVGNLLIAEVLIYAGLAGRLIKK